MNQIPSEILLPVFKKLDSLENLSVMRVCKSFKHMFDDNTNLWRVLILERPDGWAPKALEVWDQKSQSSLREVLINVKLEETNISSFIQTLEKSKESLQVLTLAPVVSRKLSTARFASIKVYDSLSELSWKLPNLKVFKLLQPGSNNLVRLTSSDERDQQSGRNTFGFKVLWLPRVEDAPFLKLVDLKLLDNLVSLNAGVPLTSSQWREILERPSKTLKDFRLAVEPGNQNHQPVVKSLEFPKLQVLRVIQEFPSFMILPSSIICMCQDLPPLPSISALWLEDADQLESLGASCPRLEELRLDIYCKYEYSDRDGVFYQNVSSMLQVRKRNVEAGLQVDKVRMIQLKRLGVWFKVFSSEQLTQMEGLVGELFDLETVPNFVEVEV